MMLKIIFLTIFSMANFNLEAGLFEMAKKKKSQSNLEYNALISKAIRFNLIGQKNIEELSLKLSKKYLEIVLFQTETKYVPLLKKDDLCNFGELLSNNLITPSEKIVFEFKLRDKNELGFLKKNDAINYIKRLPKCKSINDRNLSFKKENVKQTIELLGISELNSKNTCENVYKKLSSSNLRPYLCGLDKFFSESAIAIARIDSSEKLSFSERGVLTKKIKKSQIYKNLVSPFEVGLIKNFCNHLERPRDFCENYSVKDIWMASLNGEFPKQKVEQRCKQYPGYTPTKDNFKKCAVGLSKNISTCKTMGSESYPALFPKPNCQENSKALSQGNLDIDYQDCPGLVGNHSFIHGTRIINHLKKTNQKYPSLNCKDLSEKIYSMLSYNINPDEWPLKICYPDPLNSDLIKICATSTSPESCLTYKDNKPYSSSQSIEKVAEKLISKYFANDKPIKCVQGEQKQVEKLLYSSSSNCVITYNEVQCDSISCPRKFYLNKQEIPQIKNGDSELTCISYIPGQDQAQPSSESRVIQKAISRMYPNSKNLTCGITPKRNHRPLLLKFQVGCHIIKSKNCDGQDCRNEIYLDNKRIKNIRYKGRFLQNAIFLSTEDKGMTTDKVLEQSLEFYPQKIMSLSNLKFHLKHKNAIAYGTGCLEDLYPYFFTRKNINSCTPNLFIIDGFVSRGYRDFLTLRSTIDEVGSPRLILWNQVFNSLKSFQSIHPRKEWTLYGIK